MNRQKVEEIANAVLYEGYLLYPYRASAVKNRQRFNFGVLYPPAFGERSSMRTECLAEASENAILNVQVRFLQLDEREDKWQEARERSVSVTGTGRREFAFDPIQGSVEISTESLSNRVVRVRVDVSNTTPLEERGREQALLRSIVSAHSILEIQGGAFISLLDPPEEYREAAAECRNEGTYPVLAGEEGERDAMLSSPIILYDYPQIAAESAGSLFDGTEIDEILTLRIMTLSDEEKLEISAGDDRARKILERTESMPPEQLMKMHGALRGLRRAGEESP
jgi:hypothetical protein